MVQRIQSLYLLLTTIFSVLFQSGKILKFNDDAKNFLYINLGGLNRISETGGTAQLQRLLPLTGLLLLIPLVSLITIFLFKNRKLQIRFVLGLIILIILLILALAYYFYFVVLHYNAEFLPGLSLIFPILMLICACLAYRSIKKDDELVKSYNRLR